MEMPPVLMIVFNRPQHAKKVLDEVRKAKPEKIYIAVDGPRANRMEDKQAVKETLQVFDLIDWDCSVKKLIRKENLGCKIAVSSAISWFFENEEQGIILEDDCIPSLSFFSYCDNLLKKYKDVDSVMHINGVNFQDGITRGTGSYYFSKVCHVWGWATWRRAWAKYDISLDGVEEFFEEGIYKSIADYPTAYMYWKRAFMGTKAGKIDTWDYQWVFSVWKNNGLAISPNQNMISNIGFDNLATHTKVYDNRVSNKAVVQDIGEIIDNQLLIQHYEADMYSFKKLFSVQKRNIISRIQRKVSNFVGRRF